MTTPAGGPEWWLGMYRDVRLKTWSYSNIWIYTLRLAKNWWAMIWTHHWDIDMNSHFKYFEVVRWNSASNNTHANDQTDQCCKIALSEAFLLLRFADCALAHSHTHTHCHRDMAHSTLMSHEVFPKIGYDHDAKHRIRTACPRPLFGRNSSFHFVKLHGTRSISGPPGPPGRGLGSICRKIDIFFSFSLKFQQMRAYWNQTHWIMIYHPISHNAIYIYKYSFGNQHTTQWTYTIKKPLGNRPSEGRPRFLDRKPAGKRNWQILSRLRFGICENTAMDSYLVSTFDGEVQPISGKMGLSCWCWLRKDLGQFRKKRQNIGPAETKIPTPAVKVQSKSAHLGSLW